MDQHLERLRVKFNSLEDRVLIEKFQSGDLESNAFDLLCLELKLRGFDINQLKVETDSEASFSSDDDNAQGETEVKMVVVATFPHAPEAHMLTNLLHQSEIPAFINNEHAMQSHQFLTGSFAGIEIVVPESFIEQARQVIDDFSQLEIQKQIVEQQEAEMLKVEPAKKTTTIFRPVVKVGLAIFVILILISRYKDVFVN
jgi:hypothetical protein